MLKQYTRRWLRSLIGLLAVLLSLASSSRTFTHAGALGTSGIMAAVVTASPAALASFSTTVGTASATQTLTVAGTGLTADIVVIATTGYEVSLTAASGYAASITVAQTGGTVANTPVYARLKGTAAGAYIGYVSVTSSGAATVSIPVIGTVTNVTTAPPTITSFTPTSGPVGTTVTVTGTDLAETTVVTLNGTPVANLKVVDATTVTFNVPGDATSGLIFLTTPGGTAVSRSTFTLTAPVPMPTILSLSPSAQVVGGPALILTIRGRNFTQASTVSFRGVTYTPASSNAAALVVSIPASALANVGNYPVTVTTAAGTSNASSFIVSNPSTTNAYETFEAGVKDEYAQGTVTLKSGSWAFSDALIGTTSTDRFNGLKSARIRSGFIAMAFDKTGGAGTVTVNAALFSTDTGGSFLLEKSIDGGATYATVPGAPATLTTTLTPYTFAVNQAGRVRFRIKNTSATAARISIDDISITDYAVTATLANQTLPGFTVFPNPATDHITVTLPSAAPATVALRDLTGRCVLGPAALDANQQLRLPATLAAGIYLLEVRQGSATAVRRMQKN